MKKISIWLMIVVFALSLLFAGISCKEETVEDDAAAVDVDETAVDDAAAVEEPVTITITSWRTEDIDRMNNINAVFMEKYPNITVDFQPVKDDEYDAQLITSLEAGVGADIIVLRSFDSGEIVYNSGFMQDLNDIVDLTGYASSAVGAWATDDGIIYGIPAIGTKHGVFYLEDIFDKYDLEEPETWDEFIGVCQTLKDNGETVIAQGTGTGWPLYETMYSGLGANFYGGEVSRQALIAGDMKVTDEPFVEAFRKMKELQPFFPTGYEALAYTDSQQLFGTRQAAIYIGGSWELGIFEDAGLTDLNWFAPPKANKDDVLQYIAMPGIGMGLNKNSENYEAALVYLKWATTSEFGQVFMDNLPGFYSFTPGEYEFTNIVSQKIQDAATDAELTIRPFWEKLSSQDPSGNGLMEEALVKMYTDVLTPEEAAAFVQDGLETWYEPFMK